MTTVSATAAPSTGPPDTGRRITGGGGVGAGLTSPSISNAQRKSPRGAEFPYGMLVPPAYTARYSLPPARYMIGLELIAAPVWNRHSSRPVRASSASRLPSGWPMNIRSLDVVRMPLPCASEYGMRRFQATRLVATSTATMPPVWYSPGGRSPLLLSVSECAAAT
jgi:hypothetical protein